MIDYIETQERIHKQSKSLLTPVERMCLAFYLAGFEPVTIAGFTGRSEQAVNNALNRAKSKVTIYITQEHQPLPF